MDKYSMLRKLEGHHNDVVACEFSPDGALLATASYDTRVYLWDPHIGVILREFGWVKHSNLETISPSGLGNEQWLMEVVKWQRLEVVLPSESQVTALAFWGLNDAEEHTAAQSPLPNPRWTGPALFVWECLSSAVLAEAVSCPWACLSVCPQAPVPPAHADLRGRRQRPLGALGVLQPRRAARGQPGWWQVSVGTGLLPLLPSALAQEPVSTVTMVLHTGFLCSIQKTPSTVKNPLW